MAKSICPETGKVGFVHYQQAAKVVGERSAKYRAVAAPAPQSIYPCEHCKRWHVTSYTPEHTAGIRRCVKRRQRKKGDR